MKTKSNPKFDQAFELLPKELEVMNFMMSELDSSDPSYSCLGMSDIVKQFKLTTKATATICNSLIEKKILYTTPERPAILFISWDYVNENYKHLLNSKPTDKPTAANNSKHKPYKKYGTHGRNEEIKEYTKGDMVEFELKKTKVVGEFIHFHINKHSPKGYAVIKFDGKIFERTLSKISKHQPEAKQKKKSSKKSKAKQEQTA
jgi:hypothetical protein